MHDVLFIPSGGRTYPHEIEFHWSANVQHTYTPVESMRGDNRMIRDSHIRSFVHDISSLTTNDHGVYVEINFNITGFDNIGREPARHCERMLSEQEGKPNDKF